MLGLQIAREFGLAGEFGAVSRCIVSAKMRVHGSVCTMYIEQLTDKECFCYTQRAQIVLYSVLADCRLPQRRTSISCNLCADTANNRHSALDFPVLVKLLPFPLYWLYHFIG